MLERVAGSIHDNDFKIHLNYVISPSFSYTLLPSSARTSLRIIGSIFGRIIQENTAQSLLCIPTGLSSIRC